MSMIEIYDYNELRFRVQKIQELKDRIKPHEILKNIKFDSFGNATLKKVNPNTGGTFEVGFMAFAFSEEEKAAVVSVYSDMGLIEQLMKELEDCSKLYVFGKNHYEEFIKYKRDGLEIVLV